MLGTRVYKWKLSDGRIMSVEYTYSNVTKALVVVDMSIDGKYHRWNWMSYKGRAELMELLENDFEFFYGIQLSNKYGSELDRAGLKEPAF